MLKKKWVVMLPTKKADGVLYLDDTQSGKLFISKAGNRHLYILSDEEINEGNWCEDNGVIYQIKDKNHLLTVLNFGNAKKIIATTDSSLNIKSSHGSSLFWTIYPHPSEAFIQKYVEAYNKGNITTEVMVEYERYLDQMSFDYEVYVNKLKINPKDNTISIRKIKDSWSREEVIALHKLNCERLTNNYTSLDLKWIEENL